MKKYLLFCLAAATVAAGCTKETEKEDPKVIEVSEVTLDKKEATITVGQKITLSATVKPENASDKKCFWSSSDENTASVSDSGEVSANAVGTAKITVKAGTKSDSCIVNVVAEKILVKTASFSEKQISLLAGDSKELVLTTVPEVVTEVPEFSSSDTSVAVVDSAGIITALSAGQVVIKAQFPESGVKTQCLVEVSEVMTLKRADASELVVNNFAKDRDDTICVARGEVADVQISILANMKMDNIKAELLSFCPEGQSGIAIEPRMYWIHTVKSSRYWEDWEGGAPWNEVMPSDRRFPDPLIPFNYAPENIKKGERTGVWCDFYIPEGFEPGLYKGTIEISADTEVGRRSSTKDFYVKVYPVTVPDLAHQGLTIINWHGFQNEYMHAGYTEMYFKQLEFLKDYGQNAFRIEGHKLIYPDCYLENGKMKLNFSGFLSTFQELLDNYPALRQVHGFCFCEFNEKDEYLCWARYVEDGQLKSGTFRYDDERVHNYVKECARQLGDELRARKMPDGRTWLEAYAQSVMDEPWVRHEKMWEAVASYIKEGCPDMKTLEPIEDAVIDPELLDFPCPNLDRVHKPELQAKGNQQQWIYTCLKPQGNVANRLFGQPLINTRLIHWCNFYYNAIGYLHWGLSCWYKFDDPFTDDHYLKGGISPGGDWFIIYPGNGEFLPSLRFCNMRDGIHDYDLLKMVEAKDPAKAWEFCYRVVYKDPIPSDADNNPKHVYSGQYKFYNSDVTDFRNTRREMLEYLSK